MKMRIGIDARSFTKKQFTGIARSIYEILNVWMTEYPDNEYYLFSSKPITFPKALPNNWHIVDTPWIIDSGKLWSIFKLPNEIKRLKLDVYWGSNYVLPRCVHGTDYYVTVYDLALFKFKGIGTMSNTLRVKTFTKSACKKARRVITISKATALDVKEILDIPDDKIVVSYCGGLPSDDQMPIFDQGKVNPILLFKERFILFLSTIEPRKNVENIIHAYEKYIDRYSTEEKLVLAGKRGWKCDSIYEAIEKSKYKDRIILPGFISDDDKAYLMSHAQMFVYPSLYEGFGIPILEAFSYNLPVITAAVSSMPEVGGDAAYYVSNPQDVDEMAALFKRVEDLTITERETLNKKMKSQLAKFSWKKNAIEMMEIFNGKG